MPSENSQRSRGRPRGGDAGGRERILAAATFEFGSHGYDGTTIRSIAEAAQVDTALVHHHFGSKADLFATVVQVPISPAEPLEAILAGDLRSAGSRLAQFIVTTWDSPDFQPSGIAALRGILGSGERSSMMMGFVSTELMQRIVEHLGSRPESGLRASLVASQIVGLMTARYMLRIEPLASAPASEVIAALGPTLQRYLTGPLS